MKLDIELGPLMRELDRTVAQQDYEAALDTLTTGIANLRRLFSENPSMVLSREVFELAEQLDRAAGGLARRLRDQSLTHLEERAWSARFDSLTIAHTHRRNVMGPALIDWAECNLRLGDSEKADRLHHRVIESSREILGWGPTFDPGWITTVECLETALERSSRDYGDTLFETRSVLEESRKLADERRAQTPP